jgi:hypothetical protein
MIMKLILTALFFLALSGTTYFAGSLLTWFLYKAKPENCEKEFTRKDIRKANVVMIISIL